MAEYIKREYAIDAVLDVYYDTPDINLSGEKFKSAIFKIPAADVAPVVHGRWIDGKCSNCGVDIPTDDAHDVIFGHECRFCYYCGAKMVGGE